MPDQVSDNSGVKFVAEQISQSLKWSWRGQRAWSFATHGATICIIVFSAIAAVLSQAESTVNFHYPDFRLNTKDLATALSLCVTILSTVQAKLGFERKWIANRMTHSALTQLLIDEKTGASPDAVRDKLKEILAQHDKGITAAAAS